MIGTSVVAGTSVVTTIVTVMVVGDGEAAVGTLGDA